MAPPCVTWRIRIVLERGNLPEKAFNLHLPLSGNGQTLNNSLACFIVRHEIDDIIALRGCILWVATDILIKSRTIFQKNIGVYPPLYNLAKEMHYDLLNC